MNPTLTATIEPLLRRTLVLQQVHLAFLTSSKKFNHSFPFNTQHSSFYIILSVHSSALLLSVLPYSHSRLVLALHFDLVFQWIQIF